MFDLLTPVFAIAGAAAAAIPILLHMLRRTPSQKMMFSLVRFLRPSLPKMTRRSKIEHWPLMLLRILALVLIGLAFARPFQRLAVPGPEIEGGVDRVAILVDTSASMRRDGIREQVQQQIQDVVADLKPTDTLSIDFFSRTSRTVLTAEEWNRTEPGLRNALVEQAIESFEPDWLETRTAAALLNVAEQVSQETAGAPRVGSRRVVLITDFQRGSQLDELQSTTWPASVEVDLRVTRSTNSGNAGISLAPDDQHGQSQVRLTNSADSSRSDFVLQPFDSNGVPTGSAVKVEVAPGQRRLIAIPVSNQSSASVIAGIELLQDDHPFDNVVDLPLVQNPNIQVAHVGPKDFNDSELMRYYLQRVIDGNEVEPADVTDVQREDGVTLPIGDEIRLVIVTDVVPEGLIASIRSCLERGGTLLIALTSVEVAGSVADLLPEPLSAVEATVNDYAMLGRVDFGNALFSSFADARFSDFSSIRFWRYRKLRPAEAESAWRTVAAFDTGDPAIMECITPAGGKVVIFSSGWHPQDSQWALSTRFPPMMTSLIRQSNPRMGGQATYAVGETVVPTELVGTDDWTILTPDGREITATTPSAAAEAAADLPSTVVVSEAPAIVRVLLDQPGRFQLSAGISGEQKSMTLIVGLSSSETRTDPLPVGQLQALGLPAEVRREDGSDPERMEPLLASQLNSAELESRQKFWRWLLLAGLGCLMLEAIIAGGIERRQRLESAA